MFGSITSKVGYTSAYTKTPLYLLFITVFVYRYTVTCMDPDINYPLNTYEAILIRKGHHDVQGSRVCAAE